MPKVVLTALCLACVYWVWGTTFLALRVAVNEVPPLLLAAVRFITGGLILLATSRRWVAPCAAEWRRSALLGLLLIVLSSGAAAWAAQGVPSGIATLISGLTPCWIVLLDAAWSGRRPSRATWTAVALGVGACALLLDPRSVTASSASVVGLLVLLGGGLAWAMGSVVAARAPSRLPGLQATGLFTLFGGLGLAVASLASGEVTRFEPQRLSLGGAAAFVYLVIFGSVLVLSAYAWLLRNTSAAVAASHCFVNPVVALGVGAAWAGESLTPQVVLSAALSLAAVLLLTWGARLPANGARRTKGRIPRRLVSKFSLYLPIAGWRRRPEPFSASNEGGEAPTLPAPSPLRNAPES